MMLDNFVPIHCPVSWNYKEGKIHSDECKRTAPKEEEVRRIIRNHKHRYEAAHENRQIVK